MSFILIIAFFIIFPFLTSNISTAIFFRTVRSRRLNKKPPTLPYWVPILYHALGFATGAPANFAKLMTRKEFGQYSPFVVRAGLYPYLVLRSIDHVKKILNSPAQFSTKLVRVELFSRVLGAPKEALNVYRGFNSEREESILVDQTHSALPQAYLQGTPLASLTQVYSAALSRRLSTKWFQPKSWTSIEDLWSFFQFEITRATAETIFGSSLPDQYTQLAKDFWKFDAEIQGVTPGLPRPPAPIPHVARDKLIENLKKWLQAVHGGNDFAKLGEEDPEWDEKLGSKYFQARDAALANIPAMAIYQTRATEALAVLLGMNSQTMPATFWYIVEILRDPFLCKYLNTEIAKNYNKKTGTYNINAIAALPILKSIHAEVSRLRTAAIIVRQNEGNDFQLDNKWTIPKGMSVVAFSQDLALDTEAWRKARPETVERPLEEFWPERFLVTDKQTRRSNKIGTGRFSMDGLESVHIAPKAGNDFCPGDSFTEVVQAATLIVLFTEYEVELSEPDYLENILPPLREVAYGTVKPLDKVSMRIRLKDSPKK
ncbi:putative cytochrome-like protein P450 [Corynespora cassiicola Philippines]|uniref:Putative cytochrome-like protein P450 n=1 Tax=Corynespora cassiicola Philippines TaxID=1448308 RepID=A0A2T2NLV3_CORCC|nr:putative cytochrome-like protein P450 [Corynespora cassiicola Philippines]